MNTMKQEIKATSLLGLKYLVIHPGAHLGMGEIEIKGFKQIVNHRFLRHKPMILETPFDGRRTDEENITLVRSLREN